jgi:hypothetical protein
MVSAEFAILQRRICNSSVQNLQFVSAEFAILQRRILGGLCYGTIVAFIFIYDMLNSSVVAASSKM